MPAKKRKNTITDAERRRRIEQAAKAAEADQTPGALDRAFAKVMRPVEAKK
jgi:hypothetical protein